MKKILLLTNLLLAFITFSNNVMAQDNTSAAMNGRILDETGSGLPGATVLAVHTPTGTQYGTITQVDGKYNLPNMKTGGPYTVTVSFVGYDTQTQESIFLSLGQNFTQNFDMKTGAVQLGDITVIATKDDILNSDRTGAATNIDNRTINALPTLGRNIYDFARLTPQANSIGSGISIGGANNRFNNISIDGAVNNDVFGLAPSGTPGGQVNTQPISLDAIDEIQVVVAPYDVRQGSFTGGGINATTKSGTNNFSGTVYGFYRDQYTAGVNPTANSTGERTLLDKFTDYQTGLSVGGPIIKNKLFFFFNADITRRVQSTVFNKGDPASLISAADINAVQARAAALGLTDLNSDGSFNNITESQKFFVRFDWNLNQNHKITLRHNYVRGYQEDITRTATTFNFTNAGQKFPSVTNSTVLEWKANFSNKLSNNLILNYTNISDDRDPTSPTTRVTVRSGNNNIVFGGENSSVYNLLKQDIVSLTDNFNIFLGKHTLTIGTHSEFFSFRNDFVQNIYGNYTFASVADFQNSATTAPSNFTFNYGIPDITTLPSAKFQAAQLGFYVQDEFEITKNFKLTAGIRMDIPVFFNKPEENPIYNNGIEAINSNTQTNSVPSSNPLWSPRIGFNWDVLGDKTLQVRGGAGIFTGRVPFVWMSNQFGFPGTTLGNINTTAPTFRLSLNPDPIAQRANATVLSATNTTLINVADKNFKFPQVFRANLAVDYKLPIWGLVATVEGIFSQNINSVDFVDLNLSPSVRNLSLPVGAVTGDSRPVFPTNAAGTARFLSPTANHTNIIYLKNTNQGYTYSITGQLTKPFSKGFTAMVAYTYGDAFSVNDGTSSVALSNWQFTPNVTGPNNLGLTRSNFSMGSRIIASVNYRKEYLKNFATSIGLFYTGQSGQPVSYIYGGGDVNRNDLSATTSNDLIYIPRNASEIAFAPNTVAGVTYTAAQQWEILDQFISNNSYLNSRRGQYAERNGDRTPFQHQVDLRFMQEFFINTAGGRRHTLQITFDVFNVMNMLNKDWGFQYNALNGNNNMELLRFRGYQSATVLVNGQPNPLFIAGQTIVTGVNDRIPLFSTNVPINTAGDVNWNRSPTASRWQGQIGVRYIF